MKRKKRRNFPCGSKKPRGKETWNPDKGFGPDLQAQMQTVPLCSLCPTTKQRYGAMAHRTGRIPRHHRIFFDAEGRQILRARKPKR